MLRERLLVLAFASISLLSSSDARANLILNGSFEQGNFTGGNHTPILAGDTALTNWTVGGVAVDWHKNVAGFGPAHDGTYMVDLNYNGGTSGSGTLSQSFATTAGDNYLLRFFLAGPSQYFPNPRQVRVQIAGEDEIFSQVASPENQLVWGEQTLAFTAVGATTTLTFSSVNSADFWGPVLDDVSVTAAPAAVPEPASAALLGLGFVGLLLARRSRTR